MARTISDEELQLKRRARRRLIGAIVLVTVIVVVLPMVLDSEPQQTGQTVSVQIPSPDQGGLTAKSVPLAPATPETPKEAPKAVAQEPAPKPAPEQTPAVPAVEAPKSAAVTPPPAARPTPPEAPEEEPRPVVKAAPEKPAKSTARTTNPVSKSPAKADGKFVVQVIALADAGRARDMQGKIAAAGIRSYTEVVKTSKGEVTRVRAGPFASREAAEKAREQLKSLGMNGNVTTR